MKRKVLLLFGLVFTILVLGSVRAEQFKFMVYGEMCDYSQNLIECQYHNGTGYTEPKTFKIFAPSKACTLIDGTVASAYLKSPFNLSYKGQIFRGFITGTMIADFPMPCTIWPINESFINTSTAGTLTAEADDGSILVGSIMIDGYSWGTDMVIEGFFQEKEDYDSRISTLESLQQSINLTLMAIENQLESVKQWLFFWDYQGAEETVCTAIQEECGEPSTPPEVGECNDDSECGTNHTVGGLLCLNGDVKQYERRYQCLSAGTPESHCSDGLRSVLIEDCDDLTETCEDGACISTTLPDREVIFRTDAIGGNYKYREIVLDTDSDGQMENWEYVGSGSRRPRDCIVNTPEGYCVFQYMEKVYVNPSGSDYWKFEKVYRSWPRLLPTTSEPTEPYASKGQEVYK